MILNPLIFISNLRSQSLEDLPHAFLGEGDRRDRKDNMDIEYRKTYRELRKLLRNNPPIELEDELQEMPDNIFSAGMLGVCLLMSGLMLIGSCKVAHAYTDNQAIRVLVGEASNQGEIGMICVGEVLRHKGSIKGFYGYSARHSAKEPHWVWEMARRAWISSKTSNYTHFADHFENIHAFGTPYWVKYCVFTFEYRDHKFFKEVK